MSLLPLDVSKQRHEGVLEHVQGHTARKPSKDVNLNHLSPEHTLPPAKPHRAAATERI